MSLREELTKLVEQEKEKIEEEAKEYVKPQVTLQLQTMTPKSDSALIYIAISFYVPLLLFSSALPIYALGATTALLVRIGLSVCAVGATLFYAGYTIMKGFEERASCVFIELYEFLKNKTRVKSVRQVKKQPILLYSSVSEKSYDPEKIIKKIQSGDVRDLPIHAELYLDAYDRSRDFILVSRGLRSSDALVYEVTEVDGKWSSGIGTFCPANIVEEYFDKVPRASVGDQIPVYFLVTNPRLSILSGGATCIVEGLTPDELVKAAVSMGLHDGLYYKEKYLSEALIKAQLYKLLDESIEQAKELAASAVTMRQKDLKVLGEVDVVEKKQRIISKETLFDTIWKKIFWVCLGIIVVGLLLALVVPGIISVLTGVV